MAGANCSVGWEDVARSLARSIADIASAQVEETRFNDRVILLTLVPPNPRAAKILLDVSPWEVILAAGQGTRFELDPLPASAEEVTALALAIAGGGLTERIRRNRVDFTVRLDDGTVREGSQGSAFALRLGPSEEVQYPPYRENG